MKPRKIYLFISSIILSQSLVIGQENKSHEIWNDLLIQNVDSFGHVDYNGFLESREQINLYLCELEHEKPQDSWTKNDKLAYWINAYNAFTVDLILDHYPLKSIKEIGGKLFKVNTAWDKKFITIEGEKYDLNNIEHGIIRSDFDDPRIHFALNCASVSCPKLRNEAYLGTKLDSQLNDQARAFINDSTRNKITESTPNLSKIFKWYGRDFTKSMTLIAFINQYSLIEIKEETELEYLNYDWQLNN